MRILWIGKQPTSGEAGDEVFDRKAIAACRALGHTIDLFHPARVSRPAEAANLIRLLPHHRARFAAASTIKAVADKARTYDVVICSWEPFDALVRRLSPASILILHNVTSRALPEMFPGSLIATWGARHVRQWERRLYRADRFAAIAALSRRDLEYVRGLGGGTRLALLPPGMPPCLPLAADARLVQEIVVSGTYDWVPKRRDALLFAQAYAGQQDRLPVRADGLPPDAMAGLAVRPMPSPDENSAAIRFGLITDRFEAGHKLKTLAYIAANQIVLSFSDVSFDFLHIEDHAFFIRRVSTIADIARHAEDIAALPAAVLRERFAAFQSRCARSFTWQAVATTLMNAARESLKGRRGSAAGA